MINGNRNLYNLASRCVFKNYNSIKNITDVNGEFGNHVLDNNNPHNVNKTQIGLDNVDNTTDANKPVSTAQATAIALKANNTTVTQHTENTSNPHSVTKAQVGLSNVSNTDCTNPANIVQTLNYRFTTDTEKSTWNNKQDAITGTTDTITVITSVDFDAKTTTSKTITITNGIVTNII